MNKKSIIALTSAAVLTLGMTIGSYAWFTSTAQSNNNTFQTGTLVAGAPTGQWQSTGVNVNNMQPGDTKNMDITITNTGSLNFKYYVQLDRQTSTTGRNLLDVAVFTLKDGTTTIATGSIDAINTALQASTAAQILNANSTKNATHTLTLEVNLPTATDNAYQGADGNFKVSVRSTQTNATIGFSQIQ